MGEIEEQEFRCTVNEEDEERIVPCNSVISIPENEQTIAKSKNKAWWAWIVMYALFVLVGQSSATLLGRLYFNGGGNTILLVALLETIGFPILIPFALYFSTQRLSRSDKRTNDQSSNLIRAAAYIFLGLLQAASGILYATGLQNLPVSTYSLINTTQLGFNAFFSFFLNAQKFTPPILNSLVLLTISSTLLIFQTNSKNPAGNMKTGHFWVGFSCTLSASALYALMLSLTQLSFRKIQKKETFSTVLNMIVYQSFAATCAIAMPLSMSGEWRTLRNEMEKFGLGKVPYLIITLMIAVAWQVYCIGTVSLIFGVSSLFSNVIGTFGLPIVPILAAIFFHETIDGIKVISIVLALWGFVSYVYQHYLNDRESANVVGGNVESVQGLSVTKKLHQPEIST